MGPGGSLEANGVGVGGVVAVEREKSRLLSRCLLVADREHLKSEKVGVVEQKNHETRIWVSVVTEDACLRKMCLMGLGVMNQNCKVREPGSLQGVCRESYVRGWEACIRRMVLGLERKTRPQRIFLKENFCL